MSALLIFHAGMTEIHRNFESPGSLNPRFGRTLTSEIMRFHRKIMERDLLNPELYWIGFENSKFKKPDLIRVLLAGERTIFKNPIRKGAVVTKIDLDEKGRKNSAPQITIVSAFLLNPFLSNYEKEYMRI